MTADAGEPATQVLVNASAGGLRTLDAAAYAAAIGERLAGAFGPVAVAVLTGPELAARLRELRAAAPRRLVVAGGDGTVAAAAGAFLDTETAIGILPLGRCNLAARTLGLTLDPWRAIDDLATARPRRIDLAAVENRVFLHHVAFGLPESVIRRRGTSGARLAALRPWPAAAGLELSVDGGAPRRVAMVGVANGRLDGGAHAEPGRPLDLHVVDAGGRGHLAADMAVARWPSGAAASARTVTIESRYSSLTASVDGEVAHLIPPIRCRSLPGRLTVLLSEKSET